MIHFSEFPRSRSTYGTSLYSRIHHKKNNMAGSMLEKPNVGAPRQAEDILRGRGHSHTEALLIRKEKKKIRTNYTGQAKP